MFDIVLLDTAPLLTTNDATDVLSVADQVVIVVKSGKTHKEAADRAAELLERRNGPVLGVILVGATDVPTSRYYYYGDSPEGEEPEPGNETTSPFEALLDEITPTPKATTAKNAERPEQVVFGDPVTASRRATANATEATDSIATDTITDTSSTDVLDRDADASAPHAEGVDAPLANLAEPSTGNGKGSSNDKASRSGNGAKRSRRGGRSGGSGSDGSPESLRGR